MTRLHHAIDAAAVALAEAGVGSPRADAELLAAHAAATERGRLAFADIAPDFCERYDALVAQRAKRVPLQHLTGTAAFGPVTVEVGPGVFIPRPETESLLEWAVAQPLSQRPVIVTVVLVRLENVWMPLVMSSVCARAKSGSRIKTAYNDLCVSRSREFIVRR